MVAEVEVEKPDFPKLEKTGKRVEDAIFGKQEVDFDDLGKYSTNFYSRELLEPDMKLNGPAVIAEAATTTIVPPKHALKVDGYGNLIITK